MALPGLHILYKETNYWQCYIILQEWQAFVDSSGEHGVVLLALGTLISDGLTEEQSTTIAASLSLLPQKVVWGYSGKIPTNVGNNTKIVRWIPQNDLLGKSFYIFTLHHLTFRLHFSNCRLFYFQ